LRLNTRWARSVASPSTPGRGWKKLHIQSRAYAQRRARAGRG
jgi:hypothetical protein